MLKIAISVIIIIVFSNKNFSSCTKKANQNIQGVKVTYSIPIIRPDGVVIENKNFFNIYYFDSLIMYQFRAALDSSRNDSLISIGYRDNYFVISKDSKYGYSYDPFNDQRDNKLLLTDSMLNKHALQNFRFHLINSTKRITSHFDSGNQILKEVFVSHEVPNNKDTVCFYYTNKLKDVNFSFSKELDSIKNMKLYKIRLINGKRYYEEQKISIPERETTFELIKIPVRNSEQIFLYFDRYKKTIRDKK